LHDQTASEIKLIFSKQPLKIYHASQYYIARNTSLYARIIARARNIGPPDRRNTRRIC